MYTLQATLAVLSAAALAPALVSAASLDSVLAGQANVTTFRSILERHSDIYEGLPQGVTVLAPNDNAFRKLGDWNNWDEQRLRATLRYHVLKTKVGMSSVHKGDPTWKATLLADEAFTTATGGQRLIVTKQPDDAVVFTSGFADRGTVVARDLAFDGGLVQVIDSAMRVPEDIDATARRAYTDLTAFVGALYAAGLMSELARLRDVTVFAPRNAAFQRLAGTLEGMDAEALRRVLRYHIVPGAARPSWDLPTGAELPSADHGNKVAILRHANFVFANSAEIVQPDILIRNGVVHLIDNLLNPDRAAAKPNTAALTTAQPPVFAATVPPSATGSTVPTPFATYLPCWDGCPHTASGGSSWSGSGTERKENAGPDGARPGLAAAAVAAAVVVVAPGMALGAMLLWA
ncbi:hypothetical protein VTJ83DRAFT_3292 [Remersonia thermophila]|uniref:FAS1 domain-containing protein n=1 Tax=Remersonia thermophila TaxID=72144 RepID=A0ABR4DF19_9PEZI